MKLKAILLGILSLWVNTLIFASIKIHPTPQHVVWKKEMIAKPSSIKIYGEQKANKQAIALLRSAFSDNKKGFKVVIGEKKDKAVSSFAAHIPNRKEGYFLAIQKNKIIIAANDERGTYYGVRTLLQLLEQEEIPLVEITDYPDISSRGVVEGFYGTPWSFEDRMRQLEFYGENKLNTYIYGPKDDPYHSSPHWRKPYPPKEENSIKKLVQKAKENCVDFVWAIHPGKDIQWNSKDRNALLEKFEMMYKLGVRAFAIFFDDISGKGTRADKQAELLNFLDLNFIQKKGDVLPLIMCPTEYNKSWSKIEKGYLPKLGNELNPSIEIMWTGDRVISDIDKQGLEWINKHIKRKAYIWWNFPVSDYVRDHLLMGEAYGLDPENKNLMSGFMSNPMERAEASKIAIYSIADYAWNMKAYNSKDVWGRAIKSIMPKSSKALKIFATHNSDLGPNGHGYRRKESVHFQPIAKAFLEDTEKQVLIKKHKDAVLNEFINIVKAADILLKSNDNPILIKEIKPWLKHFQLMGKVGIKTVELQQALFNKDKGNFLSTYEKIRHLREKMYDINKTENQNPYQPGVKTASLVVEPFIDSTLSVVISKFNSTYQSSLPNLRDFCPHTVFTNISQLKQQPVRHIKQWISISPALEVIKYEKEGYIGIEFLTEENISKIKLDMGITPFPIWAEIQISKDGVLWKKIDGKINDKNEWIGKPSKQKAKFIRLINKNKKSQEAYLTKFEVKLE